MTLSKKKVPLEEVVEEYFCRSVEEAGGEVRKVSWLGRRGAPDRLALLPGWSCFVELKRPGKLPEGHQLREHKRMRDAGLNVEVIDSRGAVDAFIKLFMERTF